MGSLRKRWVVEKDESGKQVCIVYPENTTIKEVIQENKDVVHRRRQMKFRRK